MWKIEAISSALPGALRNLIRAKAPPIATATPMLPLTKVIIAPTTNGNMALTIKNLLVDFTLNDKIKANNSPLTRATAAIIKNWLTLFKLALLKIESNIIQTKQHVQ